MPPECLRKASRRTAGMLCSTGLFCHIIRSLLTLTHTSDMRISIGLFCHTDRSLLPFEQVSCDTYAYLSRGNLKPRPLLSRRHAICNRPLLPYRQVSFDTSGI